MRVSKYFDVRELVPPETWDRWGTRSIWFIRQDMLDSLDLLHVKVEEDEDLKPREVRVVVNNWHQDYGINYTYKYSGYRPPSAYIKDEILKKNPNSESLHRQGNGFDVKVYVNLNGVWRVLTTKRVHHIILKYQHDFLFEGLTTLEDAESTPSWTHIDGRNTGKKVIHFVS